MALFADEGTDSGVAASFGIRALVWQPGAVLAPLAGGWLTSNTGMEWVFVGVLSSAHGREALGAW